LVKSSWGLAHPMSLTELALALRGCNRANVIPA
jgi:hypothetical protein